MASKTTTRLVVMVVLVGAAVYFAPRAVNKVGTFLGDLVGANDAVISYPTYRIPEPYWLYRDVEGADQI